jgi:hypothetical protein
MDRMRKRFKTLYMTGMIALPTGAACSIRLALASRRLTFDGRPLSCRARRGVERCQPADARRSEAAESTLFGTLAHLWPYIWPGDRADLKMRVVWSMVLLLVAKVATLFVPFTFKWAVDALTGADTAPVQSSNWMLWLIASPLIMTRAMAPSALS